MSSLFSVLHAILHFFAWAVAVVHPLARTSQVHVAGVEARQRGRVVPAAIVSPREGYWHTSGNLILDATGRTVRIEGINWYGFETTRGVPGGLMVQDYGTILRTIKANGFNTVRIPLSNEMVEMPRVPSGISFENRQGPINADLRGLNSLEILDKIVEHAGALGLKVILDNHRSEAGDSAEESGLWYTSRFTEADWVRDWETLAARYRTNSTVIGIDLRNEPHNADRGGACWDCGGSRDWHLAAMRGGNAVLRVNPRLLIFVEGTDAYNNDWYWWGGNLEGVRRSPVRLAVPNQLVYSPHTYGPNEYGQKWFNASTTPESLETVWTKHWAFVSKQGIAPVWVGEFGTTNRTADIEDGEPGSEGQWFHALVGFLAKNPELNWTAWALNGEDADGLLNANYDAPANLLKQRAIASIMTPPATPAVPARQGASVAQSVAVAAPVLQQAAFVPQRMEAPSRGLESRGCRVSYQSRNEIGGGFEGLIEIENAGNMPIEGWTLIWQYGDGQEILRSANVRFAQHGELVMMTNTAVNGVIPAGAKLSGVTFESRYRGRNRRPVKFYLNGNLCG